MSPGGARRTYLSAGLDGLDAPRGSQDEGVLGVALGHQASHEVAATLLELPVSWSWEPLSDGNPAFGVRLQQP